MSNVCKSRDREHFSNGHQGLWERENEGLLTVYVVSFGSDENVLELDVMVIQLWECTKLYFLHIVNFMVSAYHLN